RLLVVEVHAFLLHRGEGHDDVGVRLLGAARRIGRELATALGVVAERVVVDAHDTRGPQPAERGDGLPRRVTTSRPMSTTMPTASTHSSDRRLRTSARSASAPSTTMIGRP